MKTSEGYSGRTVYLMHSLRKGKWLESAGVNANGHEMAMVLWSDGQVQKITYRSLMTQEDKDVLEGQAIMDTHSVEQPNNDNHDEKLSSSDVGARVALRSDTTLRGEVLSNVKHVLVVEWDNGTIVKLSPIDVMLESEVPAPVDLEKEYENLRTAVSEKLCAAADLIREATKIANAAKLGEMGRVADPSQLDDSDLMDALDAAGWSTSSMSC